MKCLKKFLPRILQLYSNLDAYYAIKIILLSKDNVFPKQQPMLKTYNAVKDAQVALIAKSFRNIIALHVIVGIFKVPIQMG